MVTGWTFEQPYFNGDDFFKTIVERIRSAQKSIELETYIFAKDALGIRIEAELLLAARRGVQVRILADGIGAMGWIRNWSEELASLAKIRIFHPVRFSLFEAGRVLLRINRRDHRKVWIFDSQCAFVGSMNIACEHLKEFRGRAAWRDTALEVKGESLWILREAFERTWEKSEPHPKPLTWRRPFKLRKRLPKTSIVRLNDTRRLRRASSSDLRKRIRSATSRVWLTNPYFAPSPFFVASLVHAKSKSGCDVKLLVPTISDIFFMKWVAKSYYGQLLKTGVEVYEYQPRFLHAKSVVIDNWATIGTSNLNTRSFRHDLEVDLVITQEQTLKKLEEQFKEDLSHSTRIDLYTWQKNPWVNRLGRLIAYLFGRWI